jgi:Ca2+-transporting ATPase
VSAVQNRGLRCGLVQNKMLVATVGISALTQLALVYVPFLQAVFQTEALGVRDMGVIMSIAAASFSLHEVRRRWERHVEDKGGYENVAMEELA